jgi:hypothetical protein
MNLNLIGYSWSVQRKIRINKQTHLQIRLDNGFFEGVNGLNNLLQNIGVTSLSIGWGF